MKLCVDYVGLLFLPTLYTHTHTHTNVYPSAPKILTAKSLYCIYEFYKLSVVSTIFPILSPDSMIR